MPSPEKHSPHKYEELSDLLRKKILPLPNGAKLPSVRSLMKKYSLSSQTVKAALRQLEDENLIVAKHGSGIFVSDQRAAKLIILHRSVHPSGMEDGREASIRKEVTAAGWYIETKRHEIFEKEPQLALTPDPKGNAHVVTQDLASLRPGLLSRLVQQNVPVLVLGRETSIFHVESLTTNDREIMRVLVKHLSALGHSRLALLVNEPGEYVEIKKRVECFREILELTGLPPGVVIDCGAHPGDSTSWMARQGLGAYLDEQAGRPLPFTAIIAVSGTGVVGGLRALFERGIKVPDQCSICCFSSEKGHDLATPSITDAGTSLASWGPVVTRMLGRRFEGFPESLIPQMMPFELTPRESTGPAPQVPSERGGPL